MSGMGIMLVLAVGEHSYYGGITTKMVEEHIDSPLRLKLTDLSNEMNDSGQIVGFITFTSLLCHYLYWCFQDDNPMDSLFSTQTLHELVEAILVTFTIDVALPESLPLLVTIALAVTAKELEKESIFVKQLNEC
jgi:magnesium-transporting ATPase (P-type)